MKTRLLFLMLSFLTLTPSFCQTVGDVIYSTQEQVNNNTPTGDFEFKRIIFEGEDIVDLSPLLGLITDCNELIVRNTSLTDLAGLDSLTNAYGYTSVVQLENGESWIFGVNGVLSILDNPLLENLYGLQNLRKTANVTIKNNPNLSNTSALDIKEFGADAWGDGSGFNEIFAPSIYIENNDKLENLVGFDSLKFSTYLRINNNPKLKNLTTFHNVQRIYSQRETTDFVGGLEISGNDSLEDLSGFEKLENTHWIAIEDNDNLKSCNGLGDCRLGGIWIRNNAELEELGNFSLSFYHFNVGPPLSYSISNNPKLTSIELDSVNFGSVEDFGPNKELRITIRDNENLETCNVDYLCESLGYDPTYTTHTIDNNKTGCNSVIEIADLCGIVILSGNLKIGSECTFLFDTIPFRTDNLVVYDSLSGQLLANYKSGGFDILYLPDSAQVRPLVLKPNGVLGYEPTPSSYFIQNINELTSIDTFDFEYCPDYFSDLRLVHYGNEAEDDLAIGKVNHYRLCFQNKGSVPENGEFTFRYLESDVLGDYLSFESVDGALVDSLGLTWQFSDVLPYTIICKEIAVRVSADTPVGLNGNSILEVKSNSDFDIINTSNDSSIIHQETNYNDLSLSLFSWREFCQATFRIRVSNVGNNVEQTDVVFVFSDPIRLDQLDIDFNYDSFDGDTLKWKTSEIQSGWSNYEEYKIEISFDEDLQSTMTLEGSAEIFDFDGGQGNNSSLNEVEVSPFIDDLSLRYQEEVDNCYCIKAIMNDLTITSLETTTYKIENLDSLKNLRYIGGELTIAHSHTLTSLRGLESLDSVIQKVIISENSSLVSIDEMNLSYFELDSLIVVNNESLALCNTDFICQLFENDFTNFEIEDNAEGCQREKEVELQCGVSSLDGSLKSHNIRIFPNPASDLIYIQSDTPLDDFHINLKTINGQILQTLNNGTSSIDVSTYPSGVYLISIESEEMSMVKKVVIN